MATLVASAERQRESRAQASPPARHYPLLDAGRGIAAIAVLVHHIGNEAGWALAKHGHLAVDYFLMLSGFVVAMSYEGKLRDGMPFRDFLGLRVRRLYPMIFLGAALATAAWAIAPDPGVKATWVWLQFLLIPAMAAWVLFPLNGPLWSLFYECVANVAHGALIAFARDRTIAAMVAVLGVAAAAIVLVRGDYNWGFRPGEEWLALIRVFASYLGGVLLWRLHAAGRLPRFTAPGAVAMALILAPLLAPAAWSEPAVTIAALFFCFPLAILLSLKGAERPGGWAAFAGGISFPLYAVHMPVLLVFKGLGWAAWGGGLGWVLAGVVAIAAAWAVETFYDAPIRRLLRRRSAPPVTGRAAKPVPMR